MENLKLDIEDLKNLLNQANREASKQLLEKEISILEQKLKRLEIEQNELKKATEEKTSEKTIKFEEIKKYSWDQELKFLKYVYKSLC